MAGYARTNLPTLSNMKYFDISPLISEQIAVFPSDQSFRRNVSLDIHKDHLELSSMQTTLHLGSHADAPVHYHKDGCDIAERELDFYIGDCQVITVKIQVARILPSDLAKINIKAPRILFRTLSFPNPNQWTNDFTALSPKLIHFLASKKVKLVGIDTPSIDPADSKQLESHQAVYQNNMAILEGLVLNEVPDGCYQLIALPLKIKDGDASPVRAVLVNKT